MAKKRQGSAEAGFVARLHKQIRYSVTNNQRAIDKRKAMIRSFAGPIFGDFESHVSQQPLNMLNSMISTLTPLLASQRPKHDITSDFRPLRHVGYIMEMALDNLFQQLDFVKVMHKMLNEAMFSVGFRRVGIGPSGRGPMSDANYRNGRPFLKSIPLQNIVYDSEAADFESMWFVGDYFELSLDFVQQSGWYENTKGLQPLKTRNANEPGSHQQAFGNKAFMDPFVESVGLYDVWLPPFNEIAGEQSVIVTIPMENSGSRILRITEWALDRSPYDMLAFTEIPDHPLPLSPAATIFHLHELINELGVTMRNQATRQKTILAYQRAGQKDAERIVGARDGETVQVDNVNQIREIALGGANESTFLSIQWFMANFNKFAGNPDLLGGLAPQSPTATQDLMLQSNSNMRIQDMRRRVYEFTKRISEDLAWFLWTDPDIEMPLTERVLDTDISHVFSQNKILAAVKQMGIPVNKYDPRAEFLKFHFDIKPLSMSVVTPEERVTRILTFINTIVGPLAQLAIAQGKIPDVPKIVELVRRELDLHELDELFIDVPGAVENQLAMNVSAPITPSPANTAPSTNISIDGSAAEHISAPSGGAGGLTPSTAGVG